jgi:hypothetical protein
MKDIATELKEIKTELKEIKTELKEIKDFNNLYKDEQKLRIFLKMNYYNDKLLDFVIQDLKSCDDYKKDDNLFKFYKKKYPDKYEKYMIQINYYKNNSYCSQ